MDNSTSRTTEHPSYIGGHPAGIRVIEPNEQPSDTTILLRKLQDMYNFARGEGKEIRRVLLGDQEYGLYSGCATPDSSGRYRFKALPVEHIVCRTGLMFVIEEMYEFGFPQRPDNPETQSKAQTKNSRNKEGETEVEPKFIDIVDEHAARLSHSLALLAKRLGVDFDPPAGPTPAKETDITRSLGFSSTLASALVAEFDKGLPGDPVSMPFTAPDGSEHGVPVYYVAPVDAPVDEPAPQEPDEVEEQMFVRGVTD